MAARKRKAQRVRPRSPRAVAAAARAKSSVVEATPKTPSQVKAAAQKPKPMSAADLIKIHDEQIFRRGATPELLEQMARLIEANDAYDPAERMSPERGMELAASHGFRMSREGFRKFMRKYFDRTWYRV